MSEIVIQENDLQDASERFFVEFLPGGLYQVSGKVQKPFVNVRSSLAQLDEQLNHEIQVLYHNCKSYDELVERCNSYFLVKQAQHPLPQRFIKVLNIIDEHAGDLSMGQLAESVKLSNRQLLRDFHTYLGLSGKEFSKVVRFNKLLKDMDHRITNVAMQGGFFDQSHFNKVFKQMSKTTPKKYLQNLSDFYKETYKF